MITALIQRGFTKHRGWDLYHQPTDSIVHVDKAGKAVPISIRNMILLDGKTFTDVDKLLVFVRNYKR